MKVAILYRVIQHWRAPIFDRINQLDNVDLYVLHGPNFEGTKVVGIENADFKMVPLKSFKFSMNATNGNVNMPISYFLFFKLIRLNPDIVVSEGASNLFNAIVGFIYSKIFRKKYIWWSLGRLQNYKVDIKRKLFNSLITYIERKSDAIITYSTVGKQYFMSIGVPADKIFVAVNVIDTDKKLAEIEANSYSRDEQSLNTFKVLFVGALDKEKKIDILIRAFAKLEAVRQNVELDIVGNGPSLNELKALATELQVKNIIFHGAVINNVGKFFVNADVFVLPGLGGLAISEAMVYSLPLIVSIGDGCEVDLVDETNGFRDPSLNEESLFCYLSTLYDKPSMKESMKASSIGKIKNNLNISQYINNISAAFRFVYEKNN